MRHVIWVIAQPAESASRYLCHCSVCTAQSGSRYLSWISLHKVRHVIYVIVQSAQSASYCYCSVCTKCFALFVIVQPAQSASRYLSLLSLHKVLHVICLCSVCTKCVTLFVFVQSAQSADRRDEGMQADCMTNPRSWILFIYRQQATPSVGRSVRVKSNRNLLLPRKRP